MNIWTGLLFLEGAIADAPLARELAGVEAADGATPGNAPAVREAPIASAPLPAGSFSGAASN